MFDPRLMLCCWIAVAFQVTPLLAQNSRINEEGQQQMNDATPVDGTSQTPDLDDQTPINSPTLPHSSSPGESKSSTDEEFGSGDGKAPPGGWSK